MTSAPAKEEVKTDSDQLLSDFRQDILELNKRVLQLESERQLWRDMVKQDQQLKDQLEFADETKQKLLTSQSEEYQTVEKVFSDLKKPVEQVVSNLNQVYGEISDQGMQNSIRDCLNTAEIVSNYFALSQTSFKEFNLESNEEFQEIDVRGLLQQLLAVYQSDEVSLRLLVDQTIPEKISLKKDLLKIAIDSILTRLSSSLPSNSTITITARKKDDLAAKVGLGFCLEIKSDKKSAMCWNGSWSESTALNDDQRVPLIWMARRSNLRKFNGDLEILADEGKIVGVQISLPQEYTSLINKEE